MAEPYYADFRDYLDRLEQRGKVHRWSRPINKDTEMMPLMRLQYRGIADEERKVFLFEKGWVKGQIFIIDIAAGFHIQS